MPSTKLYFKVIHNNVLMAKEEREMLYSNKNLESEELGNNFSSIIRRTWTGKKIINFDLSRRHRDKKWNK